MTPSPSSLQTVHSGLDHQLVPMQLWRKAKELGTWDPAAIDFETDAEHWRSLSKAERDLLLRLTAQFEGGEESVTRHLLPLLSRIADDGRLEEELFLTSYLWEEAKHVEGFDRFLREVTETTGSLESFLTEPYQHLFLDELPQSLSRLHSDQSPAALAEASVTYQMIIEGVLAETGYQAYYTVLEEENLMPGMQTFIQQVQRDESRHVAYGVYLLSRLVAEHGDPIWSVIEHRMDTLLPVVIDHIQETLSGYGNDIPFGVTISQFIEIGTSQFEKRLKRIERARSQSLEEVLYGSSVSSADRSSDTRPASGPPA